MKTLAIVCGLSLFLLFGGCAGEEQNGTETSSSAPRPTITLWIDPINVSYGGTSVISWKSTHAISCSLEDENGNEVANGLNASYQTSPLVESTEYTIACQGVRDTTSIIFTISVSN